MTIGVRCITWLVVSVMHYHVMNYKIVKPVYKGLSGDPEYVFFLNSTRLICRGYIYVHYSLMGKTRQL